MSQLVRAKITALGTYVPPRLLTNDDLEKLVETSNDWIVERTGIRERHIAGQGVATSDLATEAGRNACQAAGISPSEIDCINTDARYPSVCTLDNVYYRVSGGALTEVQL